ncbi:hypothetical protein GCM10010245_81590 [Streptomyces spectabilis]|nr:hypothetical protein GCM10010245_81590 [Streptomyces spectabilis]
MILLKKPLLLPVPRTVPQVSCPVCGEGIARCRFLRALPQLVVLLLLAGGDARTAISGGRRPAPARRPPPTERQRSRFVRPRRYAGPHAQRCGDRIRAAPERRGRVVVQHCIGPGPCPATVVGSPDAHDPQHPGQRTAGALPPAQPRAASPYVFLLTGGTLKAVPCPVVAVLGPPGAGKTTLTRVLAAALSAEVCRVREAAHQAAPTDPLVAAQYGSAGLDPEPDRGRPGSRRT